MITQGELRKKGLEIFLKTKKKSLDFLTDEELHTLMLWEIWRDGANRETVVEYDLDPYWKSRKNINNYLTVVFDY